MFVTIPDLGWLMTLALLVVASPLVFYGLARWKNNDSFLTLANRAVFLSILLQVMALVMFLVRAHDGRYPSLDADGLFPTSLAASPFILSGLVGGVFISLLYLLLLWRRPDLERLLPSADNLDRITYKTISSCFPLTDSDDRLRSVLGEPDLGLVLELGSERNLGGDHLVGLRRLFAHAHHPWMAWPACRVLRYPRVCRSDVHFLRCDLLAAWTALLCLAILSPRQRQLGQRQRQSRRLLRPARLRVGRTAVSASSLQVRRRRKTSD